MKTSTLTVRPHVPGAIGTPNEDKLIKEPVAKIIYGGVTIELTADDIYWLINAVNCAIDSECMRPKDYSIICDGLKEMRIEMIAEQEHWEYPMPEVWFRDNPNKCSYLHWWNPLKVDCLTSDDKQLIEWDLKIKEHPNTKWTTKWGKEP
jgi:hypothetical protein